MQIDGLKQTKLIVCFNHGRALFQADFVIAIGRDGDVILNVRMSEASMQKEALSRSVASGRAQGALEFSFRNRDKIVRHVILRNVDRVRDRAEPVIKTVVIECAGGVLCSADVRWICVNH